MLYNYSNIEQYTGQRHALGMPGTFPRNQLQQKPLVSDPGMHHGTCVAVARKTFLAFPAQAQVVILRMWWGAHCHYLYRHCHHYRHKFSIFSESMIILCYAISVGLFKNLRRRGWKIRKLAANGWNKTLRVFRWIRLHIHLQPMQENAWAPFD